LEREKRREKKEREMLARTGLAAFRAAAQPAQSPALVVSSRNMATLKELKLRISSTKNIQKITKSMKMIASTKLNRAQKDMERARVYGKASKAFFESASTHPTAGEGKTLVIAVSSDKGLCGGIHSSISRKIRAMLPENPNIEFLVIGDKSKAQLSRASSSRMTGSISAVGSSPPTFLDALLIGNVILRSPTQYSSYLAVYNEFKSVIAFETTTMPLYTLPQIQASEKISAYEVEDDVLQSLQEFNVANAIFSAMADGYASETAAKMTAMENATKNAGELIGKLTIIYNRSRQAAITTELVDIITGASAL